MSFTISATYLLFVEFRLIQGISVSYVPEVLVNYRNCLKVHVGYRMNFTQPLSLCILWT